MSRTDAHLPYRLVPPEDMPRRHEITLTWRPLVRWPHSLGHREMTTPARHRDRQALHQLTAQVGADAHFGTCDCCLPTCDRCTVDPTPPPPRYANACDLAWIRW